MYHIRKSEVRTFFINFDFLGGGFPRNGFQVFAMVPIFTHTGTGNHMDENKKSSAAASQPAALATEVLTRASV